METININTAELEDLCQIKYVGQKTAVKIIKKRQFKDIYELSTVSGLGKKRIDAIISEGKAVV